MLTCFNPSRDFHIDTVGLLLVTSPMTGCTRIFNFFTASMTDITGDLTAHHPKWGLRIHIDNPRTMTASTSYWTCSWLSTSSITCPTAGFPMVLDFLLSSKDGFFKLEVYAVLKIISLTWSIRIAACTATKEAREDIFKATKATAIKTTEATSSATETTIGPCSTVLVIGCPFLFVAQSLISFLNFLVLFLSTRLLVDIWVIFFR